MASFGLNTGLRALLSSQFLMDTVGHNIANANVDGYSRQRVDLGASMAVDRRGILIGTGVDARGVQRSVDNMLGRRIFEQTGVTGGLEAQLLNLYEVEAMLNEPDGVSLGGRFDGFFSSMSQLSNSPSDTILRTGVVQSAVELTSQLNLLSSNFERLGGGLIDEVEIRVEEVNRLAQEIAHLNSEISQSQGTGLAPNDLLDQQDRAIEQLASLVDVQTIRNPDSSVRVLVSGSTLVGNQTAHQLESRRSNADTIALSIDGSDRELTIRGGAIGGLLQLASGTTPELGAEFDRLARGLILETNRVHATGMPSQGSFSSLVSSNAFTDQDGDGRIGDERVSDAGLPFEVQGGRFYVNIEDQTTGQITRHAVPIDEDRTTVDKLIASLNEIDHLTASLDGFGHLQIATEAGYGFDFSTRLDETPDVAGTFGGGTASLGSAGSGPFSLANGDTLDLIADVNGTPTPVTITFDATDFVDISSATAQEVADVINADPALQANGVTAIVDGPDLFLQTVEAGANEAFGVAGGSSLGAFGWGALAGNTFSGSDDTVGIRLSGQYSGESNGEFTFRPNMDGTIGTTPGLSVDVFDATGQLVTSINVGEGYQPGTKVPVVEGLEIIFGLGDLSASSFDRFSTEVLANSDDTDLLASLGLNAFFVGSDAASIGVREDIEADPSLFAGSSLGRDNDTSQLVRFLSLEDQSSDGLDGLTFGSFYGEIVSGVGSEVNVARNALESSDSVMASLEQRRDQISGVNVDEELVDMLRFEQSFAAASRYISTVNQMNDEVLSLL